MSAWKERELRHARRKAFVDAAHVLLSEEERTTLLITVATSMAAEARSNLDKRVVGVHKKEYVRRYPERVAAHSKKQCEKQRVLGYPASKKHYREHKSWYIMYELARRSRARGWPEPDFDETWLSHLFAQQQGLCVVCSKVMKQVGRKNDPDVWSVDRLDSQLPYTKTNTALLCFRCNHVKTDGTAKEHVAIALWMHSRGAT